MVELTEKNYMMLSDEEIPECCGSCGFLIIKETKCFLDKEKVCLFGYCKEYIPNEVIFGEE